MPPRWRRSRPRKRPAAALAEGWHRHDCAVPLPGADGDATAAGCRSTAMRPSRRRCTPRPSRCCGAALAPTRPALAGDGGPCRPPIRRTGSKRGWRSQRSWPKTAGWTMPGWSLFVTARRLDPLAVRARLGDPVRLLGARDQQRTVRPARRYVGGGADLAVRMRRPAICADSCNCWRPMAGWSPQQDGVPGGGYLPCAGWPPGQPIARSPRAAAARRSAAGRIYADRGPIRCRHRARRVLIMTGCSDGVAAGRLRCALGRSRSRRGVGHRPEWTYGIIVP